MDRKGPSGVGWRLSSTAQEWLLDLVHEAVYIRGLDGHILFWNSGAEQMYGWSRQEAEGEIAYELLRTQFPAPLEEINGTLLREGRWESELTQAASDGTEMVVLCRWVLMRDEAGTPDAIIVINDDLTAHRKTEQKLRASELRLQTVVRNAPVVLFATDSDGVLTLSEGKGLAALGVTPGELVGKSIFDLNVENGEVIEATQKALTGLSSTIDVRMVDVVYSAMFSPVRDDDGEVTGVIGVAVDVTHRDLVEAQLRTAKESAEAANSAKSQFLANMSHEIRTPMNGVIGMTELLLGTELSAEQRDYVHTLQSSGEALLSVINDILDFSKIEAGRMELETTDFDLGEVVEGVTQLFAATAHNKGIELSGFVEPSTPMALRGDPFRIRQVLSNLVGNALKFTELGNVMLSATCVAETKEVATIRFRITDTGIGITKAQQRHLFSAFAQAEDSTSRRFGGTGLGLSIASRLSALMGGEMDVDSVPGEGSTFTFTAPLVKQDRSVAAEYSAERAQDVVGSRVLVVDDSPTNRCILDHQLASWGVHSVSAEDGPEALQRLREAAEDQEPFDLAILDMHMPGMDGITLARVITSDPTHAGVRLMLLTSVGESLGTQARQAGISAYLTKPVRQSQLLDSLTRVLSAPDTRKGVARSSIKQGHKNPALSAEDASQGTQSGARILLVEDNEVNQKVACAMLRRLGYGVDTAANGREALEAVAINAFDAVLMDIQMPELDGYAATAQLRQMEAASGRGRLPVIALTANALAGERDQALSAGMDDYLPKPIHQEQLAEALSRWVGTSKGADPETAIHADLTSDPDDSGPSPTLPGLQEQCEREVFAELVDLFLEDVPGLIQQMKNAHEQGDPRRVEHLAHTLMGSSGMMGSFRLSAQAEQVQKLSRARDLSQVSEALRMLEAEFDTVQKALRNEISESG
ncbi:PAS domain-containing hybrid sensor histidine kinase/response regulator [Nesterenkonia natronophila]|uniref:Circadian input-output histidine kinase CikA n=1 Tax=Nesterenkonia natronophila TaxID=2174932 RepID=A0A3A4G2K0_9MICC|nr:PAS domain-containing hybrid sensor histidine kinase/response regulator [Nesterenkonia natronophila]RJN32399.1 PAS domain-containing sensor histidine kinase [Nesterenkonia natronophila]